MEDIHINTDAMGTETAAAPKPAPTQAHPPKSSVDDGF